MVKYCGRKVKNERIIMTMLDVKGCRTLCLNSEKGKEEKKTGR